MQQIPPPAILREGDVTVVAPGPDYESIHEFMLGQFNGTLELTKTIEPPLMLVDLEQTRFIGSAFLGLMLRLSNRITAREGGRFAICNPTKFCRAVFETARLTTIIPLYDSRQAALDAVRGPGE